MILDHEHFQKFINENPLVTSLFCCRSCENCQEAREIYRAVAELIKNCTNSFPLIEITTGKYDFIDDLLQVPNPPLLRIYREGKLASEYEGNWDSASDILEWMRGENCFFVPNTSSSVRKGAEESDSDGADDRQPIVELTDASFDEFFKMNPSSLVRLYSDSFLSPMHGRAFRKVGLYAHLDAHAPPLAQVNLSKNPSTAQMFIRVNLPAVVIFIDRKPVKECLRTANARVMLDCLQTVAAVLHPTAAAKEYATKRFADF